MHKVLVVDDESLVRIGLKSMLDWSKYGLQIVGEAADGEAAFALFQDLQPDLLITDIKMPKKDGLWLIKMVRQFDKRIPIIVLTCHDEFKIVREALRLGANEYLIKAEIDTHSMELMLSQFMKDFAQSQPSRSTEMKQPLPERSIAEVDLDLLLDPTSDPALVIEIWQKHFGDRQNPLRAMQALLILDDPFAFKNRDEKSIQQKDKIVLEIISQIFHQQKLDFLARGGAQQIELILCPDEKSDQDIRKFVEIIQLSILRYCNFSMSAILSGLHESPVQLALDATQLKAAVDQLFYLPSSALIQLDAQQQTAFHMLPSSWLIKIRADLLNRMVKEDKTEIERFMEQLKSSIRQQLVLPSQVKSLFSQSATMILENYQSSLGNDFIQSYTNIALSIPLHCHFDTLIQSFEDLLAMIVDQVKLNRLSGAGGQDYIRAINQYIELNYANKISLNDIASHVMLSRNYVSSLFKRDTGMSLNQLLNQVRIQAAMTLLQTENITAKDLFDRVGFSDEQYFCKTFRKLTGQTVSQYKESLKAN